MKIGVAILLVVGLFAVRSGQEKPSTGRGDTDFSELEVGQKAPGFTARDQFGHEQSNETLKGSNGTILLFFRSADW